MKVYFKKKKEGLFPVHNSDKENLDRIANETIYMKNFKKVRNPEFHSLVFGMLNDVFNFQDQFDDFEAFRRRVKLLSGCYNEEILFDKKGNPRAVVDVLSWEWGKMDEYEFRALFEKIKTACAHHFCLTEDHFNLINQYD